mmetsp:Transcript_38026/g.91717  ORF Transcript_38026/g.91717 Transcript_38026/m.91717 type:complete len:205 (-) Transcript_38026:852-1466(-)
MHRRIVFAFVVSAAVIETAASPTGHKHDRHNRSTGPIPMPCRAASSPLECSRGTVRASPMRATGARRRGRATCQFRRSAVHPRNDVSYYRLLYRHRRRSRRSPPPQYESCPSSTPDYSYSPVPSGSPTSPARGTNVHPSARAPIWIRGFRMPPSTRRVFRGSAPWSRGTARDVSSSGPRINVGARPHPHACCGGAADCFYCCGI